MHLQIKGGPLLQKQLVHNATIANIVPRWQTFEATQFELQVRTASSAGTVIHMVFRHSAAARLNIVTTCGYAAIDVATIDCVPRRLDPAAQRKGLGNGATSAL